MILDNCMIRIIKHGVAADLRKTEATERPVSY